MQVQTDHLIVLARSHDLKNAPKYPGGITEVLVDISECLSAQRYSYPGDSRDRYEVLWGWAAKFEADFLTRARSGEPSENYYEEVDLYAIECAEAAGWTKNPLYLPPGVVQVFRSEVDFEPPTQWLDGVGALTFSKLIDHLEECGRDTVKVTRMLWRGDTPASVRMRVEATGEGAAQSVAESCRAIRQRITDVGGKLAREERIHEVFADSDESSSPKG